MSSLDRTSVGLITIFHELEDLPYLNEVVKESGIEGFGECVSSVGRLFRVERDLDVLSAFHYSTDEFRTQRLTVDAKQIRRKVQI